MEQIKAIEQIEEKDYNALKGLGFETEEISKKILENTSSSKE